MTMGNEVRGGVRGVRGVRGGVRSRRRLLIGTAVGLVAGVGASTAVFPSSSDAYVYDCAPAETTCVKNYNRNAVKPGTVKNVAVVRVVLAGHDTPSLGEIKSNVRQLDSFYDTASRGQLRLKLIAEKTVQVESRSCSKAQNEAVRAAGATGANAFLTVYSLPHGLCGYSHAGGGKIFLNGSLFRDYAHETGHLLGLGHGNKNLNGVFDSYGDPTTYMGSLPSDDYNIAQLHWLGWTKKEEVVGVNAAVANGGTTEVTLRPLGRNAEVASPHALGAVYEIPGTDQRLFISMPKGQETNVNKVGGGEVFVYRAPKCVGCTGMSMGTTVVGRFGPKTSKDHVVWGLTINPVRYESTMVRQDGRNVERFSSVTLRISVAA